MQVIFPPGWVVISFFISSQHRYIYQAGIGITGAKGSRLGFFTFDIMMGEVERVFYRRIDLDSERRIEHTREFRGTIEKGIEDEG